MALKPKQQKAAELLALFPEKKEKEIAAEVNISPKQLWVWKTKVPEFMEYYHSLCQSRYRELEALAIDKLKANVGMRVMRRGEASYCALLDAGTNWYEANHTVEFLLEADNTFTLIITPLNGKEIKYAQVTLEGLPNRPNAASRLHMEMDMPSETCIRLTVEDLGFGEIFPASNQKWTESFEVA